MTFASGAPGGQVKHVGSDDIDSPAVAPVVSEADLRISLSYGEGCGGGGTLTIQLLPVGGTFVVANDLPAGMIPWVGMYGGTVSIRDAKKTGTSAGTKTKSAAKR